jgi:hypothetical protein
VATNQSAGDRVSRADAKAAIFRVAASDESGASFDSTIAEPGMAGATELTTPGAAAKSWPLFVGFGITVGPQDLFAQRNQFLREYAQGARGSYEFV